MIRSILLLCWLLSLHACRVESPESERTEPQELERVSEEEFSLRARTVGFVVRGVLNSGLGLSVFETLEGDQLVSELKAHEAGENIVLSCLRETMSGDTGEANHIRYMHIVYLLLHTKNERGLPEVEELMGTKYKNIDEGQIWDDQGGYSLPAAAKRKIVEYVEWASGRG